MSQTHTHGPGQPSHSHEPAPQQQPQQQQQQIMRPPDPVMQQLIEESFQPVDVVLGAPDNSSVLCAPHSLEKCAACDADYTALNRISRTLQMNPNLRCPPPPNIVSQKLSQAINTTKEEGNVRVSVFCPQSSYINVILQAFFKAGQRDKAIQRYTMAASIAAQRPPWEASQLMREEVATVVSNRSVAYLEEGDPIGALVDAETVIALKKPWSKGHFRKTRALIYMKQFEEAKEAVQLGMNFEPANAVVQFVQEMAQMLVEIEEALRRQTEESVRRRQKREDADH
ncbi:hypothetical protein EUX98_g1740 [Antrodiella citrinella]|uniref:Uncharacterized protein n=1 Tax=Antrodiella citrinella TaxID=2447956 RepID=A0A4S4N2A1_9APHY|nr:hypothetical protein EUX98_g1740 [Antrodiella citrinella]